MIKEEKFYDSNGVKFMSRTTKLKDRFDEEKGYLLYYNGHTISGLAKLDFPKEMGITDVANLALLSRHLVYNDNYIGYRSNDSYPPMTVQQIAKTINSSTRHTYRFLKNMTDLGMMAKVTIEYKGKNRIHYLINPLYYMNGRNVGYLLYLAFQDQLAEHIPEWAKNRYKEQREGDANGHTSVKGQAAT